MSRPPVPRPNPRVAPAPAHDDHAGTIASFHERAELELGGHQRFVEKATEHVGRPRSIYMLLGTAAAWVAANSLLALSGHAPWDAPPFHLLQGAIGLYAAVTATMVLTTQARQQAHSDQRADVQLQVNIASEQKAARAIGLLEELRRDLPSVRKRVDPQAEAMAEALDPAAVLEGLEGTPKAPRG